MDQANPYAAPEPVLPTASEVSATVPKADESADDLTAGLSWLRRALVFFCVVNTIACFWNICYAYGYLTDDPLPTHSEFFTYWINFILLILGECFYVTGLFFCSTRKLHEVSRAPLIIALILGALIFPDQLFQYALTKPWIYFEGLGNTHASFVIDYFSHLSWLAVDCWFILWTSAQHDTKNQKRALTVIFLDAACLLLLILNHTMYVLLIVEQPTDHANLGIYSLLSACSNVLAISSMIISFRILTSILAQLHSVPARESPLSSVSSV